MVRTEAGIPGQRATLRLDKGRDGYRLHGQLNKGSWIPTFVGMKVSIVRITVSICDSPEYQPF